MTAFEISVMDWMQTNLRSVGMDYLMLLFTRLGDYGILWIALAVILVFNPKTKRLGWQLVVALLCMLIVNNLVLKMLFSRARPCQISSTTQLLIDCPSSFSFPSGHTSSSFAAFGILYFSKQVPRWVKGLTGVVATLIAVSRVYLYVHFPSDVIVGAVVGFVIAWATVKYIYPLLEKRYYKLKINE